MRPVSIHLHAIGVARSLGIKLGILISAAFIGLGSAGVVTHIRSSMDSSINAQRKNFAFWIQVNDIFQIHRALGNLVDTKELLAAQLIDSDGNEIAYKGPAEWKTKLNQKWSLGADGIFMSRAYPIHEVAYGQSPNAGTLRGLTAIPGSFFVWSSLGLVVMIISLITILERQMIRFVSRFTGPVMDLAHAAESADTLQSLKGMTVQFKSYSEIETLASKYNDLAARLVTQETLNREAERAKALFQLSSQVAHDIRSPLSALRMASQTLNGADASRKVLLTMACDRIEGIAEDLLKKYRDNKGGDAGIGSFRLLEACEEISAEKAFQGVKINLHTDADVAGAVVKGVTADFKRLLSNLINNSVEAMGVEGQIHLRLAIQERSVSVRIHDNGNGIPADVLSAIKAGKAVTTKKHGNGIGLVSSRSLIESWGGSLEIHSKPGEGTLIILELPRYPADATVAAHSTGTI